MASSKDVFWQQQTSNAISRSTKRFTVPQITIACTTASPEVPLTLKLAWGAYHRDSIAAQTVLAAVCFPNPQTNKNQGKEGIANSLRRDILQSQFDCAR